MLGRTGYPALPHGSEWATVAPLPEPSMQQYLVIQLARFGDIVQTRRLVLTLARRGAVHLCVDRTLASLARLVHPEVVVHEVVAHGAGEGGGAAMLAVNARVFETLRQAGFDEVYNLNHSGLNLAMSALFPSAVVRGHRLVDGQPVRDRWVRMAFRWTTWRRLAPLNLVDFWASLAADPVPPGEVNPVAVRGGGGIGVVLAGRASRRSLPPDVLAACLRAVFEGMGGARVVLFGSQAERPLARQFMRMLPGNVVERTEDLVGRTDWAGLVDALCGLDTVLTPDTGTMHLAARFGVPVQAFFLSSAWCHETGPYGLGHKVWQAECECLPCLETAPCTIGVRCLDAFRDTAFLRLLAGRPGDMFPRGMMGMVSTLDTVGATWLTVFGEDVHAPRRVALRELVGEYLGLFVGEGLADASLTELLYAEQDWMLPPPGQVSPC